MAQEASGPIVLGQSCALSGPSAQLGTQFSQGAKLYFDQLNAQGGIGRRMVELRTLDDGYEPERCVANTQKFLADEVMALFGYLGTPTSMAALPLLQKAQVPLIAPLTGGAGLRDPKLAQTVFNLRASYADETALMVKQLVSLGLKKIAVFYQNDAYGQSGLDGVTQALQGHGLKPVGTATVERNSQDVSKAVKTLVPLGADVVVQVGTYAASAALCAPRASRLWRAVLQRVVCGNVGTGAGAGQRGRRRGGHQVVPSPYKTSHPLAREFQAALQKGAAALQPNYSSMEGYLAARVVAEALKSASAGTPAARGSGGSAGCPERPAGGGFSHRFPASGRQAPLCGAVHAHGDGKVRV